MQRNSKTAIKTQRGGPRSTNPKRSKTGKSPETRERPLRQGSRPRRQAKNFGDRAAVDLESPVKVERGPWKQKALLCHGDWSMVTEEGRGLEKPTEMGTRMYIERKG